MTSSKKAEAIYQTSYGMTTVLLASGGDVKKLDKEDRDYWSDKLKTLWDTAYEDGWQERNRWIPPSKAMIEALARQDEKERIMKIVEHYTRIAGDRHEPTYQRFLEEINGIKKRSSQRRNRRVV